MAAKPAHGLGQFPLCEAGVGGKLTFDRLTLRQAQGEVLPGAPDGRSRLFSPGLLDKDQARVLCEAPHPEEPAGAGLEGCHFQLAPNLHGTRGGRTECGDEGGMFAGAARDQNMDIVRRWREIVAVVYRLLVAFGFVVMALFFRDTRDMYGGLLVEFLLDVFNGEGRGDGLGVFGAKRDRIGPLAVNIVGTGLGISRQSS